VSKVYFVGCGPGDPDLITVKAKKLIQKADVVVYSGSLIPPEILKLCKKAKTYEGEKRGGEERGEGGEEDGKKGKNVVRLHDGDPSIYGAIREQMDNLYKEKIDSVIIPGVTSFLASAAALGVQLTLPGVTQTMIISRAEKRTKVPKREKISELAKHRATMIFYLSIHLLTNIVKEALAGGYPKTTPVGVVYRASWNDEKIITGTLSTITKRVRDQKITRTAIIIIGDVIKPKSYEYSRLYDKSFSHGFRKSHSKSSKN